MKKKNRRHSIFTITKASIEAFRRDLHKRRKDLIVSSMHSMKKFMAGESWQTLSADQEEGDCSVAQQFEYMSYWQCESKRESLKKIDLALQRLNEGNYGVCADCGQAIHIERLKAIPFALFCKECQEEKERHRHEAFITKDRHWSP